VNLRIFQLPFQDFALLRDRNSVLSLRTLFTPMPLTFILVDAQRADPHQHCADYRLQKDRGAGREAFFDDLSVSVI
jgi:hypothetical protein